MSQDADSMIRFESMKDKPSEEFREFDRVMRGLLSVSYQELQGELKKEKQAKAKKKRATSPASSSRASSSPKKRLA